MVSVKTAFAHARQQNRNLGLDYTYSSSRTRAHILLRASSAWILSGKLS